MLTFGGPPPLAIDQSRATAARAELRVEVARAVADRSADGAGPHAATDRTAVQAAEKAADAADAKVKADQAANTPTDPAAKAIGARLTLKV